MDDAVLGLGVAALIVLALLAALVYDLRGGRSVRAGDVNLEAVRRARMLDARHQQPGPPGGTFP